jgi:hypothetical protein
MVVDCNLLCLVSSMNLKNMMCLEVKTLVVGSTFYVWLDAKYLRSIYIYIHTHILEDILLQLSECVSCTIEAIFT